MFRGNVKPDSPHVVIEINPSEPLQEDNIMRREFGQNLTVSIYGESHSDEIGVVVQGLPIGTSFDVDELAAFMARRAPGRKGMNAAADAATTARRELDEVIFEEGVRTDANAQATVTGDLVKAGIRNRDRRSGDYDALRTVLRPGHADIGAYLKDGPEGLRPGSGRFSGRMTAPLCIIGGIAKQLLAQKNISVDARYTEIGGETEEDSITEVLQRAAKEGDSVGGIVECVIRNYPAGIGGPLFEGLEGAIAQAIFAIPAVKGIEFGSGFASARLRGSENNDPILLQDGKLVTETNHAGGINGGISTGMDIVFRVAFKPTPTISKPQRTVNIGEMRETVLRAGGRHDVCVVPRAVPVVEAAAALVLLDARMGEEGELDE